jgi:hypothetical protein
VIFADGILATQQDQTAALEQQKFISRTTEQQKATTIASAAVAEWKSRLAPSGDQHLNG